MEEHPFAEKLEQLRNGTIDELLVEKEVFMDFRSLLLRQPDSKNFLGRAQKGGSVLYTYQS